MSCEEEVVFAVFDEVERSSSGNGVKLSPSISDPPHCDSLPLSCCWISDCQYLRLTLFSLPPSLLLTVLKSRGLPTYLPSFPSR